MPPAARAAGRIFFEPLPPPLNDSLLLETAGVIFAS